MNPRVNIKNKNIMKTLSLFSIVLLLSAMISAQGKTIKLSGQILGAEGKTIFINAFKNNKAIPLDSTVLSKKGKFKLEFKVTDPKEFYNLSLAPKNYALLILDSSNTESKITFVATSPTIAKNYVITGSKESKDVVDFSNIVNDFQNQLDRLKKDVDKNGTSIETSQKKQQELYLKFQTDRNNFVDTHMNSLALLTTTSYFNPQAELVWFKKIEKGIAKSAPNSKYHQAIKGQVQQIENALKPKAQQPSSDVNIGKQVTELNFKSPNGEVISLASLKGKYVLVDFWASWCRPCRNENPNVVKLYNKYKDAGFTVYSVALDTDKNRWVNAIKKDNLTWPNHVSDLKGWKTEATKIYQFRGIPYTMLVDKEGKIIATKLRGKQLEDQLKMIFGF